MTVLGSRRYLHLLELHRECILDIALELLGREVDDLAAAAINNHHAAAGGARARGDTATAGKGASGNCFGKLESQRWNESVLIIRHLDCGATEATPIVGRLGGGRGRGAGATRVGVGNQTDRDIDDRVAPIE